VLPISDENTTKKPKRPRLTTPIGIASWPNLFTPRRWDQTAKKMLLDPKEGKYSIGLILPLAEAQVLIDQLDPLKDEAIVAAKDMLREKKKVSELKALTAADYFKIMYGDDEEPNGNVMFRFSQRAAYEDKTSGEITPCFVTVVDRFGKPWDKEKLVYGGSTARVHFSVGSYYNAATNQAGISFTLIAAQIITAADRPEQSLASMGFEVMGEEEPKDIPTPTPTAAGSDDF
jgi:hypothetical protein